MDFDYWEEESSNNDQLLLQHQQQPRTSFTVYTSEEYGQQQMAPQMVRNVVVPVARNHGRIGSSRNAGCSQQVLLDNQEELDSIRAISKHGRGDRRSSGRQQQHHQQRKEYTKLDRYSFMRCSNPSPVPSADHNAAGSSSSFSIISRNANTSSPSAGLSPSRSSSCSSSYPSSHQQQPQYCSTSAAEAICSVCGDGHAKLHYGVIACYGCKGFFRRTLTGKYRYVCRFGGHCVVDKFQRNACRYCRFNRCLEVGMDPKAVRPDRDLTGKQKVPRVKKRAMDEELLNHMMRLQGDEWSRKIPVEAKMLLMQLLNIESKVAKGDSSMDQVLPQPAEANASILGSSFPGLRNVSLRELFEQRPSSARRTEMCYDPMRMARPEELPRIAHRGAIAAVDWVESLAELMMDSGLLPTSDKISLVKQAYAPLTIFNFSARTAQNTSNRDILCLCSYSYVPRKLPSDFNGSNHLSNNLIDRTLNELVNPLRRLQLKEEEVVALKAIIILDPNAKHLSAEAQRAVSDLRDRIQDMLFQVVKELHPAQNPAAVFGNLLLLLPTITILSSLMCENMQFCQVFGWTDPLLNELFDDANEGQQFEDHALFDAAIGRSATTAGSSSLMPISYSPPMLGDPAEISLYPNTDQKSSPNSPPRHLLAASRGCSTSRSSLSPSTSSSMAKTMSATAAEKCEISTQTEIFIGHQQPAAETTLMSSTSQMMVGGDSYGFEDAGRSPFEHHHQTLQFGSELGDGHSPFPSMFDTLGQADVEGQNEFSAADLFDSTSGTPAEFISFGLMR